MNNLFEKYPYLLIPIFEYMDLNDFKNIIQVCKKSMPIVKDSKKIFQLPKLPKLPKLIKVPLSFWFNKNPIPAIPYIGIDSAHNHNHNHTHNHNHIEFRDEQDLIIASDAKK